MSELVYLDHAAATPTDPRVAETVASFSVNVFANPSSAHTFGAAAELEMRKSAQKIAELINSKADELIFTATGTESNNLAVLGIARANRSKGNHIITTTIEHPSILNACRALERDGFEVTYLNVDSSGLINVDRLQEAVRAQTILVATHYGNSELGILQPIKEIGAICRERSIYFHVDACQAMAYAKVDVIDARIDLLTFNGSKMYGPKGVAVLYVREGVQIFPIVYGGGQQQSLRSGTENVPGIVGLAKAAEIISEQREDDAARIGQLRDQLQNELEKIGVVVNVKTSPRLPNHLSVTLPTTTKTDLVAYLSAQGIGVSSGSACSSRELTVSTVLQSIGLGTELINQTIRITLGRGTTRADCQRLLKALKSI